MSMTGISQRATWAVVLAAALLAGCSSAPRKPEPPAQTAGAQLVGIATQLIGSPYRYGGTGPREFDCSGLVHFSHEKLGIPVPRTAADQRRAARAVPLNDLRPGDLVFFRIASRKVDHVGIYAGNGRFIHAPGRGKVVSYAWLEDPYYRSRFVGAGRFLSP
ncbi:MAG TPA: C40 family peptidase [Steroidobacteraceae bacterium]